MRKFKGRIDFHMHEVFKLSYDGLIKEHRKYIEDLVKKKQCSPHSKFT